MNNPPDISQDSKEYEEYAHGIRKHVRGYLMVGALLLAFTGITVALSYVHFGTQKANIAVAMLVATVEGWASRGNFHASRRGKTADLPHPDFHRFFCVWRSSGLSYLAWYDYPVFR